MVDSNGAGRARVVVASQNRGKAKEISEILRNMEVLSLAEFAPVPFPEEGGDYEENAAEKARVAARAIGLPCVADDSGLEVEALDGGPGAYSARYGGPGLDDAGRTAKLIDALRDVPAPRRARFYCVAAFATPDGRCVTAAGACEGEILLAPRGEGGFGYDPVFQPVGWDRAMAELTPEEKASLSHRGRALRALAERIPELDVAVGAGA